MMGRILLFSETIIKSGVSTVAILKFEKPITISIDDYFIIRKYSPLVTVGGGKILDLNVFKKWKDNKKYVNQIFSAKNYYHRLSVIISNKGCNPFTYKSLSIYLNISIERLEVLIKEIESIKLFSRLKQKNIMLGYKMNLH